METFRKIVWVGALIAALMLWFAADKISGRGQMYLVGWIVFALGYYALSCWRWPFGACACCGGKGAHYRGDNKVHRPCKKRFCRMGNPFTFFVGSCGGAGRRLRWGRRISNFVRAKTGMKAA